MKPTFLTVLKNKLPRANSPRHSRPLGSTSLFSFFVENKNFIKLWGSQMLSQITFNMVNFTLILKIFETTGSTIAVSLLLVFAGLPAILLGPFTGVIIDSVSKKGAMMSAIFLEGLIILLYLFVGQNIWPIYSIFFLFALVNQFYIPAEAAMLPSVVGKASLPLANSIFMFTIYGAIAFGFGLAGPFLNIFGNKFPFLFGALCLFSATIVVSLLPKDLKKPSGLSPQLLSFWNKFIEGLKFIKEQKLVLLPILVFVAVQIAIVSLAILFPSYSANVLKTDLRDASFYLVMSAVGGALISALCIQRSLTKVRKKDFIKTGFLLGASSLFGISLVIPMIQSNRLFFTCLLVFFAGLAFVLITIPVQTLIQEYTPLKLRGRVFGALGFLITLSNIAPALLVATVADVLGAHWVVFIFAAASLLAGLFLQLGRYEINTNHRT